MRGRPIALVFIAACSDFGERETLPPQGQLLFSVTTDATLPVGPTEVAGPDELPPVFDRLRVELFEPGMTTPCPGCAREFGIDRTKTDQGRTSMGFVVRPGVSGYRARVLLFRSSGQESKRSRPGSTLETTVLLPVTAAEGIVEASVVLSTNDLTVPRGTLEAPIPATNGRAPTGVVGTYQKERALPCAGVAGEGEACVVGGAFWVGDLTIPEPYERLAVVSSFYVDAKEVTVGEVRASGLAADRDPIRRESIGECTYSGAAGLFENHPVTCVSKDLASRYCEAQGKRLPSLLELMLLGGGRRSSPYPWGSDAPACADVMFARASAPRPGQTDECLSLGEGPAPAGSGARDRLVLGGVTVLDIAGNVSEWTADIFNADDEPCWAPPIVEGVCTTKGTKKPNSLAVFGGNFKSDVGELLAATRQGIGDDSGVTPRNNTLGFRCARTP